MPFLELKLIVILLDDIAMKKEIFSYLIIMANSDANPQVQQDCGPLKLRQHKDCSLRDSREKTVTGEFCFVTSCLQYIRQARHLQVGDHLSFPFVSPILEPNFHLSLCQSKAIS
ncbi:hypothetical protein T01_12069 [Trichinella spiralis]|uniref:Uncharacterized protein n=1 Tax=Trichinella spiralis TaxID=6334 RepID=A0A0V1BTE1_TRISP|nr:hypothetical protein T01_12069 [Trichinella spiralis]